MLRAAAAPERFLDRGGFARFVTEHASGRRRALRAPPVLLPRDLERFLGHLAGRTLGDFVPRTSWRSFEELLGEPVELVAFLAGALPIGETRTEPRELVVAFLDDGIVAALRARSLRVLCRGAAELAVLCSLDAANEDVDLPFLDEDAVAQRLDRARTIANLLRGKRGSGVLVEGHPVTKRARSPLALGSLAASFLVDPEPEVRARLAAHEASADAIVRDAAAAFGAALDGGTGVLARARARAQRQLAAPMPAPSLDDARAVAARFAALVPNAESYAAQQEREETLLAFAELGPLDLVPELLARALTGDVAAVDLLGALGDAALLGHLAALSDLDLRTRGVRAFETAVARLAAATRQATPILLRLLEDNPLRNWRDGLERGLLVREVVTALGEVADPAAAAALTEILDDGSQEYRPVFPAAAWALGRLRHRPAFEAVDRLLRSPKEPASCEAVWAAGALAEAHADLQPGVRSLLDRLAGLEPGAEATRLVALAKLGDRRPELEDAIERALREPGFRQEETARRQIWGLRALEELAALGRKRPAILEDHELVRWFVTRDDQRVHRAATAAFRAWAVFVPRVRAYFSWTLPSLERGGLDALHEAVRDPLGRFRHNVATRLAELGDPRSAKPLAQATARLFADPITSTYEYDDAPPPLVAFVRALAKLNRAEGNDVLIEGLRSGNHQVRAVIAENAPDDARFVPELMAMLGDSRSFLRSRAERSLAALGALSLPPAVSPETNEFPIARRAP